MIATWLGWIATLPVKPSWRDTAQERLRPSGLWKSTYTVSIASTPQAWAVSKAWLRANS
ncbi:hypothetical protein D3C84_1159650 [compost metagenome]